MPSAKDQLVRRLLEGGCAYDEVIGKSIQQLKIIAGEKGISSEVEVAVRPQGKKFWIEKIIAVKGGSEKSYEKSKLEDLKGLAKSFGIEATPEEWGAGFRAKKDPEEKKTEGTKKAEKVKIIGLDDLEEAKAGPSSLGAVIPTEVRVLYSDGTMKIFSLLK